MWSLLPPYLFLSLILIAPEKVITENISKFELRHTDLNNNGLFAWC